MDISTGLLLVTGAGLLWLGGEGLVAGSVAVARRLRLAPVLIGVVLMGFGTSLPELVTSVDAALGGAPAIAIGNVVGSNTANILLIVGVAALIAPIRIDRDMLRRDAWFVALAAGVLGLSILRPMDAMDGMLLVLMLVVYLMVAALAGAEEPVPALPGGPAPALPQLAEPTLPDPIRLRWALPSAVGGIVAVIFGAHLFVQAAVDLAEAAGVSQAVIGASIVAVGTSLPELATSVVAALRRQPELSLGNILGSNIFNVFGVLGASAIAAPLIAEPEVLVRDLPVMLAATVALVLLVLTARRISRSTGALLLAGYAGYMVFLAM